MERARGERSTVCLSMYSITENICYSHLSSVAILLRPEPNCLTSYNTMKWLCSLSLSVLSSCSLPLPLACLLLTVNEARSSFASTIPCNVSVIFCCLTNRFLVSFISRHFNHTIKEPRPKSQSHEAKAITSWVQLPVINPNKVRFVMNKSACRVYVYGRIILKWTWQQRRVVSLKYADVSEMRTASIL
jgi:hypothetical protein